MVQNSNNKRKYATAQVSLFTLQKPFISGLTLGYRKKNLIEERGVEVQLQFEDHRVILEANNWFLDHNMMYKLFI